MIAEWNERYVLAIFGSTGPHLTGRVQRHISEGARVYERTSTGKVGLGAPVGTATAEILRDSWRVKTVECWDLEHLPNYEEPRI